MTQHGEQAADAIARLGQDNQRLRAENARLRGQGRRREMSDTSDLRPCPFCGGSAILEGQALAWTVTCENCGMQTAVRNKPEQATADWNSRVPLVADAIAACEAEYVSGETGTAEDAAYNRGVRDCIEAIKELRG